MKEKVLEIINSALSQLNVTRKSHEQIPIAQNIQLFGQNSLLDSMELVYLLIDIEERINENLHISIRLMDEKAISQKNSPFKTVDSLSDYIISLL